MTTFIASSTQNVKSHNGCIKWWVDKQNYSHNRIVFSNKKNKELECSAVWIKFKDTMLRTIHCIFLSLWNEQKIQIDKFTEQIVTVHFWGWKYLKSGLWSEYVQLSTVTTHHWILHLWKAIFMIGNLYINETIMKENKICLFLKKKSCFIC